MFLWRDGLLELPPPLFFLFFFFLKKNSVVIEEVYFCLCFLVISVVRLALYSCSFSFCFLLCNFCSVLTVSSGQFSRSVMFDSLRPHGLQHTRLPCLSPTPQSLFKLMSIESVMPSKHLILCRPLLWPSILPSLRVFSIESVLCIRWPKY